MVKSRHRVTLLLLILTVLTLSGCGNKVKSYSITGRIINDANGQGVANVTVLASYNNSSTKTDTDGKYTIARLRGTVTVTPSKTGWFFNPSSVEITQAASNVDFAASSNMAPTLSSLNYDFVSGLTSRNEAQFRAATTEDFHMQITTIDGTHSMNLQDAINRYINDNVYRVWQIYDLNVSCTSYTACTAEAKYSIRTFKHQTDKPDERMEHGNVALTYSKDSGQWKVVSFIASLETPTINWSPCLRIKTTVTPTGPYKAGQTVTIHYGWENQCGATYGRIQYQNTAGEFVPDCPDFYAATGDYHLYSGHLTMQLMNQYNNTMLFVGYESYDNVTFTRSINHVQSVWVD